MRRRAVWWLVGLGAAAAVCVLLRLMVGGAGLHLPETGVVWDLRGKRALSAVAVGVCLAVSGVCLQSLLRNPLASPDLLGLAPGAGFAVALALYLHYRAGGGLMAWAGHEGPALVGSMAALGGVYALSQRRGLIEPVTMILVGVIIGLIFGSATVFVQQLMPDRGQSTSRWLLGSLSDDTPWARVVGVLLVGLVSGGLVWWLGRAMDAASLSEDEARSVGVSVGGLRAAQFVVAGVLAAGAVTLAGPIGFVGLVAPHGARLMVGPGHRGLVVGAGLLGAVMMLGADTAVKAIELPTGDLPIGVLTATLGGPFFLVLLLRRSG